MPTQFQIRRDSAFNWADSNPTLAEGEFAFEIDTNRLKIGNGVDNYNSLDYANDLTANENAVTTQELAGIDTGLIGQILISQGNGTFDWRDPGLMVSNDETTDIELGLLMSRTQDGRTLNLYVDSPAFTFNPSTNILSVSGQVNSDLQGSVSATDNTVLVDGVSKAVNLDGTVKGNITPDSNETHDIGSSSLRFKDIYLSGNTIDLAEATIKIVNDEFEFRNSLGDITKLSLGANDTDDLSEGSNLYYTDIRARNAISASGDLSYNATTGEMSFTERTDAEVRGLVSAAGDLSYNSTTGEFSVTTYKSTDFDTDFANKSTDDLSEGSNLYYTDARVDAHLSGGIGVDYTLGTISIGQRVGTSDDVEFNNLTLSGNLTVSGTTTTVNTEEINLADNKILLNSNFTGSSPTENGGIEVERGDLSNKSLEWNETDDKWTVGTETFVAGTFEGNLTGDVTGTVSTLSNHTTDDLSEGNNLYYTDTRVRDAISASGDLSYNSTTGEFSFTERTDAEVRGLVSASGDLSYNSTTGEFSVITYKSTDFDNHFDSKSTTDLDEGTRLYYTDSRANSAIDTRVTKTFVDGLNINADQLDGNEGNYYLNYDNFTNTPTNVSQFTNDANYIKLTDLSSSGDLNYNNTTGEFSVTTYKTTDFNTDFNSKTTDDLAEGLTNQYFTASNVDAYITAGTGVNYSNGEISIGQPVAPTDNVTFETIVSNGGIVFGPDVSAKTTLNDYEEGNWVPVFDSINAGTGRSTTVFFGSYTKVGRQVTCNFSAELASLGSGGSGQFVIGGLPFTGSGSGFFTPIYFENLLSSVVYMSGAVQVASGRVLVSLLDSAGTSMNQSPAFDTYLQAGTRIDGTIIYFVD